MQPENVMIHDSKMNGLVASRYDYDGTYLYVTMNVTGRWNYVVDLGYSCDSGDVIGGKVLRYYFTGGVLPGSDSGYALHMVGFVLENTRYATAS